MPLRGGRGDGAWDRAATDLDQGWRQHAGPGWRGARWHACRATRAPAKLLWRLASAAGRRALQPRQQPNPQAPNHNPLGGQAAHLHGHMECPAVEAGWRDDPRPRDHQRRRHKADPRGRRGLVARGPSMRLDVEHRTGVQATLLPPACKAYYMFNQGLSRTCNYPSTGREQAPNEWAGGCAHSAFTNCR